MNDKIAGYIAEFLNKVGDYLYMEYDPIFYREFTRDKNLANMFDFVGSYYMGGSSVPDTARFVVELILMKERENREQI